VGVGEEEVDDDAQQHRGDALQDEQPLVASQAAPAVQGQEAHGQGPADDARERQTHV